MTESPEKPAGKLPRALTRGQVLVSLSVPVGPTHTGQLSAQLTASLSPVKDHSNNIAPPQTSTFPLCSQKNVYEQQMGSLSNPDLRSLGLREAEHPITMSKSGMPAPRTCSRWCLCICTAQQPWGRPGPCSPGGPASWEGRWGRCHTRLLRRPRSGLSPPGVSGSAVRPPWGGSVRLLPSLPFRVLQGPQWHPHEVLGLQGGYKLSGAFRARRISSYVLRTGTEEPAFNVSKKCGHQKQL